MARWHVNVVRMRARDITVGDVVARDPERFDGWFRVHEVRVLGDGTINLLDKSNTRSFTAGPFDLVGLQTPVPLPAEAERNVRREEASRADRTAADQAAEREAVARKAQVQTSRALPGS